MLEKYSFINTARGEVILQDGLPISSEKTVSLLNQEDTAMRTAGALEDMAGSFERLVEILEEALERANGH